MNDASLTFLQALVHTASPSGYESEVAKLYRDYVTPYADRLETDVMGNVIASINPDAGFRIMIAAHMDEIGLMIHHIGEDGFLHFQMIGGNDSVIADGQRVWVHGSKRVPGVVGRKSATVQSPAEAGQRPSAKELWIDIGASSRQEAEGVVRLGDVATFQADLQPLLGSRAAGRAFDNKAGLFVLAETVRHLSQNGKLRRDVGVHAVATVQEEIGSRGARTATFAIDPQVAIAIDMGVATDIPNLMPYEFGLLSLGQGPAISRGPNTNRVVFEQLRTAAMEDDIPFQVRPDPASSPTDARVLQVTKAGVATALLEVPLRYMHTPCEVLDLSDVQQCAQLLARFCERASPEISFSPV